MEEKELVIDKDTVLRKINDKENYTKLILRKDIKPSKLKDFINIKELIISPKSVERNNYNERNINNLSFAPNIEKLILKNIRKHGEYKGRIIDYKIENYSLKLPKLKSIELSHIYSDMYCHYLDLCTNLEEVILNVSNYTWFTEDIYIDKTKVNTIKVKYLEKEYTINLDYKVTNIVEVSYVSGKNLIYLKCCGHPIETIVKIDVINNQITKHNILSYASGYVRDNTLNIPDYITKITSTCSTIVNNISLNLKLLSTSDNSLNIIDSRNLKELKSIILRQNDMSLFPTKEINTNTYGEFKKLYIFDNKLFIYFNDFILVIDENGTIEKKKKEKQEVVKSNLDNYTINELGDYLEFYTSYKKLLTLTNDKEYTHAMEIVEDRILKKVLKK